MLEAESSAASLTQTDLDRCRAYLDYQANHSKQPSDSGVWPPAGPAITISYQTGAGAGEIARQLATLLEGEEPEGSSPWGVYDRQLVEHALEEHHLPKALARHMTEDRRSYFDDVVDEFLGLRPPSWELMRVLIKSVRHLAYAGNVILVGWGAGVVTKDLPNLFHVRLVASLEKRIERVQRLENLSSKEAAKLIEKKESGRGRYIKAYFRTQVDDDLHYHLVLNTDLVPPPAAAGFILYGAKKCFCIARKAGDRMLVNA